MSKKKKEKKENFFLGKERKGKRKKKTNRNYKREESLAVQSQATSLSSTSLQQFVCSIRSATWVSSNLSLFLRIKLICYFPPTLKPSKAIGLVH